VSGGAVAALALTLAAALPACRGRRGDQRTDLEIALDAADELFARRTDPAKLAEARDAYLAALAMSPGDPAVYSRLAYTYAAFAYGYPEANADMCGVPGAPAPERCYELALEYGFTCLEINSAWSSRITLTDGDIDRKVAAALNQTDLPCLQQVIPAWIWWVEERGPSAHLYLESIRSLSQRSLELAPGNWQGAWGTAMSYALPPPVMGPELTEAARWFDLATQQQEAAIPHADRLRYLEGREEDSSTLRRDARALVTEISGGGFSDAWALENRRAAERLEALLEQTEAPPPEGEQAL
jgi:hypothetical protein